MLQVRDLTVRFGGSGGDTVVDSVSFDLAPGQRLGLIGESGSGKSLTALALMGLLPPSAVVTGSIRLDGSELIGAGERDLARLRGPGMTMVFQDSLTALNPLTRVIDQLRHPLRRHRGLSRAAATAEAERLLSDVGLASELARAYPTHLSGGQRQRVCIAMALACRPALLIADEPTTALDVTVQAEIIALLDRVLNAEELSAPAPGLLFITHDLPVVAQLCAEIIVLRQGGIVERGSLPALLEAPADSYTRDLVAAARALSEPAGPLPGTGVGAA